MAGHPSTFVSMLDDVCRRYPDREAVVTYDGKMSRKSLTFTELWSLASKYAHVLRQAGVNKGDYVVVSTPLSLEFWVSSFGVLLAGGVHISMEKLFSTSDVIVQTVNLSQSRFLILSNDEGSEMWEIFKHAAKLDPANRFIASVRMPDMPSLRTLLLTNRHRDDVTFLEKLADYPGEYQDRSVGPADGAVVGTSMHPDTVARPKLCEVSHGALTAQARVLDKAVPCGEKNYNPFPWYIAGSFPFDNLVGTTRILPDMWVPLDMELYEFNMKVKDAETLTHVLATVAEMSHVVEKRKSLTGKYVDTACTGGQPITRAVYDRIQAFSSKLYIMYFGSEPLCVSVNEVKEGNDFAPFDAGFPVEGVEIRILDEELREVGAGVSGTIVIRSPTLFTRYVGEPDRTDAVWWKDGWFISADAGYLSPEGRVFVFGRSGDVISRGIVLTYPAWVEKPISSHPEVLEIMAVPVPDDINVENICACVVKKPGSDLTETAVKQIVKDSMTSDGSYYITVDHVLFFEGALPKLSRKKLGQVAAARLGLLAI